MRVELAPLRGPAHHFDVGVLALVNLEPQLSRPQSSGLGLRRHFLGH
jgi:hypothetical protein